MSYSEHQLAVMSAQKHNILPITSVCNLNCIFCSHLGNSQLVQTFASGHRSLGKIKELISFLQPEKKIVIGESITRICEGEPFTHPQFKEILQHIRANFPPTLIKLTSNGTKLTAAQVDRLAELKPIELNLSLNSSSAAGRKQLMNDQTNSVLTAIKYLQDKKITYHGSIVAMPHLVGWEEIEATIDCLDCWGAETIRVFLPGYTKFSPEQVKFELSLWDRLEKFVANMQRKYPTPITLEPSRVDDLTAQISGVIPASPADKSGLKPHDEILTINQEPVFSRVDAYKRLLQTKNPQVKISRKGTERVMTISKETDQRSGIVVDYDLDYRVVEEINRLMKSRRAEKILMLTSQLAEARLNQALDSLPVEVKAAANNFFGGSIMSAGLLTVEDFSKVLLDYSDRLNDIDLVLLPEVAFDFSGTDLVGEHYRQLEEEFEIPVETLG